MNNTTLQKRYFDAAANTPLDTKVWEEMQNQAYLFGNNNAKHTQGQKNQRVIDSSLEKIADILGTSPAHLCVTYSGTDSNRRILWETKKRFGEKNMYASRVEHSSVLDEISAENLFSPEEIKNIPENALFLAQMRANSETGTIFSAENLRQKFPNAFILQDAAQSVGKIPSEFGIVDAVSFAPQKIYGPIGIGLLWLKSPQEFPEISKDAHTKNPMAIAGMAKAFELLESDESKISSEKIKQWSTRIETFCKNNIPDIKIHGETTDRVPGIINIAFSGIRGGELMTKLNTEESIAISIGSACTSDILTPTKTIQAIETDPKWQYPVRISLHKFLTDESIQNFCEVLEHYVDLLRKT